MRIKNFTLMLMAVLFSVTGFAQKPTREALAIDRVMKVQKPVMQSSLKPAFAMNSVKGSAPASVPAPRAAAKASAKAPEVVTPPEKGELEYFTLTGTIYGGDDVTRTVKVVWDPEDEDIVYVSGLSYYMPNSFVMGTFNKEGDQVTFKAGQYMGNPGADIYFGAYGSTLSDAVAAYDEAEGTFTFSSYLLDNGDPKTIGFYAAWEPGVVLTPLGGVPDIPVEIPKDLEYEKMVAVASDYFEDNADYSTYVNVGFYGRIGEGCDVYIQGLSSDIPEAWVKGTFANDSVVVFESGQMLNEDGDLYFVAIDGNFDVADEYILIYDPVTGSLTEGDYCHIMNAYKDSIYRSVYQLCTGYEIKRIQERAATPSASRISNVSYSPSGDALLFNLAKVDEDYEGLVPELLSYKLYYMDERGKEIPVTFNKKEYSGLKEDLEEIPATFTDGKDFFDGSVSLNMDHSEWVQIGIQGIYYGERERRESRITWHTPTWPQTITLPEGLTVTEHTFAGELYDSEGNEPFERTVGLAFDGDDMYIRGLGDTNDDVWVKGTKNSEGAYVFPKGQSMGDYDGRYSLFLVGVDDEGVTDVVVTEDGTKYTFEGNFLENASYTDRSYYLNRFVAGAVIYKAEAGQEVPEVVEIPEGLETEKWIFKAYDYFEEAEIARPVSVGINDDEIYVQGLSSTLPDAWVKGLIDEEDGVKTVSFASGQYLGDDEGDDLWFIGFNIKKYKVVSYVMEYDEENFTLSNSSKDVQIGVNAYKAKVDRSVYEFYNKTTIKKIVERAATPVTPSITHLNYSVYGPIAEFNIPTMDTEGEGLVDSLISYKLFYDEGDGEAKEITFTTDLYEKLTEDMTVIPYGFLDDVDDEGNPTYYDFAANFVYLNMLIDESAQTWARIGIQSIYRGGGETNASEIGWYTPTWPQTIELPEGAEVTTYAFTGTTAERTGDVEFSKAVNIALVDNDIYIQGVGTEDEEAWIKGTKKEGETTYTFPKGQDMGVYYNPTTGRPSHRLFLLGYNDVLGVMDAKLSFDEETGVFTTTTDFVENADYTDNKYYLTSINAGAEIKPVEMDRATTPETPSVDHLNYSVYGPIAEFTIPMTDVEGLPISGTLLSYKFYYDEGDGEAKEVTFAADDYDYLTEDMTIIPYGFLDAVDDEGNPAAYDFDESEVYMNMLIDKEARTWARIGIQAIYAGGGETNASEIGWYTPTWPQTIELPEGAEIRKYDYYYTDIQGNSGAIGGLSLAIAGDDVYIQRVASVDSEAWIKGTKDATDGTYSFDMGQELGIVAEEYQGRVYYSYLFLLGYDLIEEETAVKMSYDEETGVFTTLNYMSVNADYTDKLWYTSLIVPGAQFVPGDGPDAIATVEAKADEDAVRFNIAGQRVGKNYKGLIIEKNKKFLQK